MSGAIEVEGLRVRYPGAAVEAVRGVSFAVQPGEIFGLLGPSGAGKSSTQRVLTGRLRRFEGQARALGVDLRDPPRSLFERLGVAFETPNLYTRLSAWENLRLFSALYRGPCLEVEEALARVGLLDDVDRRVEAFSKGMRLRLNLARALLNRPELLFLDEPSAGQDPVNAHRIRGIIQAERARGATVLLTTHDMGLAAAICDRVGFVVEGRLVAVDAPQAFAARAGAREVEVELEGGGRQRFPLDGLVDDPDFAALSRAGQVKSLHSREANLEQVFHELTGHRLLA